MGVELDRLLFDPADANNSPNVGAYLRAGSDGDQITSTLVSGKEALDVNVVGGSDSGIFSEDAAHASGDKGQFVLAVRNDTQGSLVNTDGDYSPLQVDAQGRLRVITDIDLVGDMVGDDEVDSEDPLKIGSRAVNQASALSAISAAGDKANVISDLYRRIFINSSPNIAVQATPVTVGTSAVALPSSALAGRMKINVQNRGSASIYIGPSGVTTSSGTEISKGGNADFPCGQGITLYAISGSAGQDVRVLEFA